MAPFGAQLGAAAGPAASLICPSHLSALVPSLPRNGSSAFEREFAGASEGNEGCSRLDPTQSRVGDTSSGSAGLLHSSQSA
jgi:hypothetical protein